MMFENCMKYPYTSVSRNTKMLMGYSWFFEHVYFNFKRNSKMVSGNLKRPLKAQINSIFFGTTTPPPPKKSKLFIKM